MINNPKRNTEILRVMKVVRQLHRSRTAKNQSEQPHSLRHIFLRQHTYFEGLRSSCSLILICFVWFRLASQPIHNFHTCQVTTETSRRKNLVDESKKFRFIDLFCGIGGFRIAFERAGCKCVFSSDWNKYARLTYEKNFGKKPHGDIHSVAVADIPEHDILCAGFPCQPFSIAGVSKKLSLGKAHGFDDKEQGNLFFALAEIIEFHQPAAFRAGECQEPAQP